MRPKLMLQAILLATLNSCAFMFGDDGLFPNRGDDYLEAKSIPQMEIPSQLDSYTLDQLYVVPPRFSSLAAFEEVPMPEPIETRRREGVIIQSLNARQWIVIDATPAQVWPLVRDYWTDLEIILDYEDPSLGLMDTSWVEVGSNEEKRHKYRITIEPGLHSGYSEIYVTHMENLTTDAVPLVISWPEQSVSSDLERQVLTSVSQYLADRNDVYQASSASLLAGSIEAESKANIVENDDGEPILELKLEYGRAWVQIRQALERADVIITDSDRDQAVFNVEFSGIIDEDDQPGLFARWFGGDDKGLSDLKTFNVYLLRANEVINVVTEPQDSFEDSGQISQDLLQVIDENLS